ncbi:MAG: shikimate dehydrogenase [Pseudomonadota bacterium]
MMDDDAARSPTQSSPHACVIGWPISHSRSPCVHGYWLETLGVAGSYTREAIAPDALGAFFDRIRDGSFVGCNITLPHKEAALALVDEIAPAGRTCGAINTVWRDGARLVATSTDGAGFVASLDQSASAWRNTDGTILILGAGGAARGIVDALIREGRRDIVIANRTKSRADDLSRSMTTAHSLSADTVTTVDWSATTAAVADAGLIINTTVLGMVNQLPLEVSLAAARPNAIVTDIVYTPLETELLRDARARGLTGVDGLGMLLHQAVPGFERWFGVRPDVTDALREHTLADDA